MGNEKSMSKRKVVKMKLYSDGACSGNPGPGAYAAILDTGEQEILFCRSFILTTNNRMELLGIIEPLESMDDSIKVEIWTDSQYVSNAINEKWLENWQNKNWKKSDKKSVLNIDLWKRFIKLLEKHDITINWIKGHNDHPYNTRCDSLAVSATFSQSRTHDIEYEKVDAIKKLGTS